MAKPKPKPSNTAQTLIGLGLTENEAVLYTLLLTRSPSTVHEMAPTAPFPRTLLYHVLNQLVARGLVSVRDNEWRAVYTAQDPTRLYDVLAQRKRMFDEESERVRELVPKLKRSYQLAGARPNVRMFDGVVEYQKALDAVLVAKPKELLAFEQPEHSPPAPEVYDTYERTRVARGIRKRVLFVETKQSLCALETVTYNDYTHFRSVSRKLATPFARVLLYNGNVLYTRTAGHEPTALLVQDEAFFDLQKSLFMGLWNMAQDRTLYFVDVKQKKL